MNVIAWSLLLLGWLPYTCQSTSPWGSWGGTTCPFSWCVPQWLQSPPDCGKVHKEDLITLTTQLPALLEQSWDWSQVVALPGETV